MLSGPANTVLGIGHLQKVVAWARQHGVIVASDECYAELDWRADRPDDDPPTTPSLLDPRVTGGDVSGLLTAYSLSKQSNLAGYRAGFLAGDPALVAAIGEVRKHAGMMMPAPVQAAMIAALDDHEHVAAQVATYRARRERLLPAAQAFGLRIDDGEAVHNMSKKEAIASRAVVLFAHGSRDPLWRKPVETVAARLRERDASAMIACAYLELTEPDLQTAVKTLVNEGASSIRVGPMFLGVGRHAREDLPLLMTELRALYPKVVFELQQSIGEDQRLIDLIADIAMSP